MDMNCDALPALAGKEVERGGPKTVVGEPNICWTKVSRQGARREVCCLYMAVQL